MNNHLYPRNYEFVKFKQGTTLTFKWTFGQVKFYRRKYLRSNEKCYLLTIRRRQSLQGYFLYEYKHIELL